MKHWRARKRDLAHRRVRRAVGRIAPRALPEMLAGGDAAAIERVMKGLLEMKKLDIATLRRACGPNQEEES